MKGKIKTLLAFSLVFLFAAVSSCKVNEHVQPKQNASMASIPELKTYLSKMLLVGEDEISYTAASNEFIIRKSAILPEDKVQDMYRIANEYKLRNGITVKKID